MSKSESRSERMIWRVTPSKYYHARADCPAISGAQANPIQKPLSAFPADWLEPCPRCHGGVEQDHSDRRQPISSRRRNKDVVDALREEGAVSRRKLQQLTNRSRADVRRAIESLRDSDVVSVTDNPDDGRIPLYQLDSERAQTPPGLIVLLTVLLAMLAFAAWLGVMYP